MKSWTESEFNEILNSEDFIKEYVSYKDKSDKISSFLKTIKLNTKYFRLTTNNKIGKNVRFKNKNISTDTISMKEINSFLNKLTDRNKDKILKEIKLRLVNKDYLQDMIIENIIQKSIVQSQYNEYYIDIITDIYKDYPDLNKIIEDKSDQIYKKILNKDIDKTQSEYLQYCDQNKHLDLLIGYSLLLSELEKKQIVTNKIDPALLTLLEALRGNDNSAEKYKCSQCLYNIFKSYYGESILPQGYIDKINELIKNENNMKIKFKLMDIIERR